MWPEPMRPMVVMLRSAMPGRTAGARRMPASEAVRNRLCTLPAPEPLLRVRPARANGAQRVRRPARGRAARRGVELGRPAPRLRRWFEQADRRAPWHAPRSARAYARTSPTSWSRWCAPATSRHDSCRSTRRGSSPMDFHAVAEVLIDDTGSWSMPRASRRGRASCASPPAATPPTPPSSPPLGHLTLLTLTCSPSSTSCRSTTRCGLRRLRSVSDRFDDRSDDGEASPGS